MWSSLLPWLDSIWHASYFSLETDIAKWSSAEMCPGLEDLLHWVECPLSFILSIDLVEYVAHCPTLPEMDHNQASNLWKWWKLGRLSWALRSPILWRNSWGMQDQTLQDPRVSVWSGWGVQADSDCPCSSAIRQVDISHKKAVPIINAFCCDHTVACQRIWMSICFHFVPW